MHAHSPSDNVRSATRRIRSSLVRSANVQVHRSKTKSSRHGFTLIELVAAISMLTTILIMTGTIFHLLLRSDKAAAESFVTERSISRLAVQFRDDIHRATTATIVQDPLHAKPILELDAPSQQRLQYVVIEKGIARLTIDGTDVVAREDYHLPDCRIRFSVSQDHNPRLRSLIIERPGGVLTRQSNVPRPYRPLSIEAFVGRLNPSMADRPVERPADATDPQPAENEALE